MDEEGRDADALALRRRRIRWRAWHRGLREVDLILGRFADARLETLDADAISAFEALLDVPDQEVFDWVVTGVEPPPGHRTALFEQIVAFQGGAPSPRATGRGQG